MPNTLATSPHYIIKTERHTYRYLDKAYAYKRFQAIARHESKVRLFYWNGETAEVLKSQGEPYPM